MRLEQSVTRVIPKIIRSIEILFGKKLRLKLHIPTISEARSS